MGVVTRLLAGRSGVRIPVGAGDFCFPKPPDRRWVPPSLIFNGCRGSFPGTKWPGRVVERSFPSRTEVKNE